MPTHGLKQMVHVGVGGKLAHVEICHIGVKIKLTILIPLTLLIFPRTLKSRIGVAREHVHPERDNKLVVGIKVAWIKNG